jgi:ribosome recycling factor
MKVPQVAHVTIMDAQTIKIEPWDKNELKHIEKAIYDANAGLTPQNEGSYIIVKIPALTQERRTEITKQVKAMGEEIKGRIRLARQEAMKDNKAIFDAKEIGEDESKRNEKDIDALVKSKNDHIDQLVKAKSEEIMTM